MSAVLDPCCSISYWQKGFDDGFAGLVQKPPATPKYFFRMREGYKNGYRCGAQKKSADNLTLKATPKDKP